jgi:rhamnulokinase
MARTDSLLAIDLGAESGRGVVGRFDGKCLQLEEVRRFSNQPITVGETLYWDVLGMFSNIQQALDKAKAGGALRSVGVDTWGVDFGLLDRKGNLIGNPVHYRDRRTEGMMAKVCEKVPREEIFNTTGIMFLELNTLYQLYAMALADDPQLEIAQRLLNMPDLLHYWLSGVMANETTIASTTQCLSADRQHWANQMLWKLKIPTRIFGKVVPPGTVLGPLRTDSNVKVIAPAGHDTGSAVMAVPAKGDDYMWISSGTWSVVGIVTDKPVITPQSREANFTNEALDSARTRFSRNVMGLWILQECRREWARQGQEYSYTDLVELAKSAPPLRSIIDPDNACFLYPGQMPKNVQEFCAKSGQSVPQSPGEISRCVVESLALAYKRVLDWIVEISGRSIRKVHIFGGGSQNKLMCQFTADALGLPVIAGPVEATAIGNIMVQAQANGLIGSFTDITDVVQASFGTEEYEPTPGGAWAKAYEKFKELG